VPALLQQEPAAHAPQPPPQPSLPHCRPAQLGAHVQTPLIQAPGWPPSVAHDPLNCTHVLPHASVVEHVPLHVTVEQPEPTQQTPPQPSAEPHVLPAHDGTHAHAPPEQVPA
jgi:hypothetical protein